MLGPSCSAGLQSILGVNHYFKQGGLQKLHAHEIPLSAARVATVHDAASSKNEVGTSGLF
jgi:hypothetical protein